MALRTPRQRESATPSSSRRPGPSSSKILPAYESPEFPLSVEGQRAMSQLLDRHNLLRLEKSFKIATDTLSNNAVEINDRLEQREVRIKRRVREDEHDTSVETLEELRDKVQRMTDRIDESMRKMIDAQHAMEGVRTSIRHTSRQAMQTATQTHAATQRGQESGDGSEVMASVISDFEPTNPEQADQSNLSTLEVYRNALSEAKTRYQSHSLGERYSTNNDYINFRRLVHDAQHPEDDVPLPHPSEWFTDGAAPAPGITTRNANDPDEDEEDDDIAVSRAKISIRCPITLQEFKEPITSRNCPHSFEKSVVLEMLAQSSVMINGRPGTRGSTVGGQRAMRCPVGGCDQFLTKDSLHVDPVITRKIKRIQLAKHLQQEDQAAASRGLSDSHVIDDGDDDDGADIDELLATQSQATRPKVESNV